MYQLPSGHQNSRGWALTAEDLGIVDLASEVRTEAMSASSTCSEDSWEFHDFNLSLEHEPRYLPGTSKLRRQYRCTLYDYYGQGVLLRRRPRRHTSRPRKPSNAVQPDVIDRLDDVGLIRYHHEGPYDAVYPERNRDRKTSAVEAVKNTTAETLKATPPERIRDCLDNHRPLEGVAVYASGGTDPNGRMYDYEEATNVISERDVFFQIPGLKFPDGDVGEDPFKDLPSVNPVQRAADKFTASYKERHGRPFSLRRSIKKRWQRSMFH